MRRFAASKDPESTVDYQIDWSPWLGATDTIQSSSWTVSSGLTYNSDSYTTTDTTLWVSGGTVGAVYLATNSVTTVAGRIAERTIYIRMIER